MPSDFGSYVDSLVRDQARNKARYSDWENTQRQNWLDEMNKQASSSMSSFPFPLNAITEFSPLGMAADQVNAVSQGDLPIPMPFVPSSGGEGVNEAGFASFLKKARRAALIEEVASRLEKSPKTLKFLEPNDVHDKINKRDRYFHATHASNLNMLLRDLTKGSQKDPSWGLDTSARYTPFSTQYPINPKGYGSYMEGTSVSRYPMPGSMASRNLILELKPDVLKKRSRIVPIKESTYKKTGTTYEAEERLLAPPEKGSYYENTFPKRFRKSTARIPLEDALENIIVPQKTRWGKSGNLLHDNPGIALTDLGGKSLVDQFAAKSSAENLARLLEHRYNKKIGLKTIEDPTFYKLLKPYLDMNKK